MLCEAQTLKQGTDTAMGSGSSPTDGNVKQNMEQKKLGLLENQVEIMLFALNVAQEIRLLLLKQL